MALSQVHFKFKSAVDYDSVSFDGPFVSVGELKTLVAERAGMGPAAARELVLSDPRTGDEYRSDAALVPKSASVLVRRAPTGRGGPAAALTAVEAEAEKVLPAPRQAVARPVPLPRSFTSGGPPSTRERVVETAFYNPYRMKDGGGGGGGGDAPPSTAGDGDAPGDDEDAALHAMLTNTGTTWKQEVSDAARAGRGRGRGRGRFDRAERRDRPRDGDGPPRPPGTERKPPPHYVCRRCNQTGHFMSSCPTQVCVVGRRVCVA